MQIPARGASSVIIVMATCVLTGIAGCCSPPDFVFSIKSSANAENELFNESLVGTWEAFIKDEPYLLITVTRHVGDTKNYTIRMHSVEDLEGAAEWSGSMRLLRIGDHEFVELESTIPKEAPPEEQRTVDGHPLRNAYSIWRVTHANDTLQIWGFDDKKILESLPKSELVPLAPRGKIDSIANCSSEELRKFLLENGGKMTRKAEDFKRCK